MHIYIYIYIYRKRGEDEYEWVLKQNGIVMNLKLKVRLCAGEGGREREQNLCL